MRQRQVVFVLGVPRSGSTWLTDILSSGADTDLVMEPDNEKTSILASYLKTGCPRFPQLAAGAAAPRDLGLLWDCAFTSNWAPLLSRSRLADAVCALRRSSWERTIAGKPTGRPAEPARSAKHPLLGFLRSTRSGPYRPCRIIKSVHAVLYPEWIVQRCRPQHTVVIMRHPLAVLQSWRRMRMADAYRLVGGAAGVSALSQSNRFIAMANQLCIMYASLMAATEQNPGWQVIWHETLCTDPRGQLQAVAENCDIAWTTAMEDRVLLLNQSGKGYRPRRNAADEIDKWRREVSASEEYAVRQIFEAAGMSDLI